MRNCYKCGICHEDITNEDWDTGMREHLGDWTKHGFIHASCHYKDKYEKEALALEELQLKHIATLERISKGVYSIQETQSINRGLREKIQVNLINLADIIGKK